ncbi:MAG: bifunctional folylpolyglutamate synthase/dihydrofolate synthase [Caldilineales bacterium]|nr:bifunctional folylpolyglutamate synthase/dihydrofolate synthase [Caldilineales bacterium]MDW8316655.1 folylpolyglutamate synthase/dihydrofolate synthase family protein [Anaerolineae bacterium]
MALPASYQAALDYIFNYVDYERRRSVPYTEQAWDLGRMRRALAALGDPHQQPRFVHIAGSKGKGSTAAMVEAVLRASGLRVGFYSSPHLHTVRERIRVDGQLIGRDELVRLLDRCRPAIEATPGITTFEILTLLAFVHFAEQGVPWVVLEVGLGGRLDATNVVTPAVSVITPISFEHTAILGNTLDQIAREKAGIIKPGVPVVTAPQEEEAFAAIAQVAGQRGSRLEAVGHRWRWTAVADGLEGQVLDVERLANGRPAFALSGLRLSLLGAHQQANAVTALAALCEAVEAGAAVTEAGLRRGLATVYWPGRLEVLRPPDAEGPAVVVDSAHNDASARLLRSALAHYFRGRRLRLVVGVSTDKDLAGILSALAEDAERLVAVRSRHPRAADPRLVVEAARGVGLSQAQVASADTVADGLALALDGADADRVICAAGSLFVAAEAREAWLAWHPDAFSAADWAWEAEPPDFSWQITAQRPAPGPA